MNVNDGAKDEGKKEETCLGLDDAENGKKYGIALSVQRFVGFSVSGELKFDTS